MTTMLERASRAAQDEFCNIDNGNGIRWGQIARAVLMAVREPDEAMEEICDYSLLITTSFTAMIDAILEEKE